MSNEEINLLKEQFNLMKDRIQKLEDENKMLKKFVSRHKYQIHNGVLNIVWQKLKSFKDIFYYDIYTKEELDSIIYFNCSDNEITSFEGFPNLPNLRILICQSNRIESVEGLGSVNIPNLQELNCRHNKIKSFESLSSANLPNLIKFDCFDNPLDFVYQNRTLQEIYHINELLKKCQDNTKILIVKKFLKDKIRLRLISKD